jgi:hypothetical protein
LSEHPCHRLASVLSVVALTTRPRWPGQRTTMKSTMMPGPIASAASVDGANEPTARPSDVDANDSSVSTPQNCANLPRARGRRSRPARTWLP